MVEAIVKQEIIVFVMGVLAGVGIIAKLVSYMTVRKMVKAAGEMQKSTHRLMKLVKAKFEHASMISDKVQNVRAFVDKYIYEYEVLRLKLCTWQSIPKKMLWIIGIVGGFCMLVSDRKLGDGDLLLKYMQWTIVFGFSLLLFYYVLEEETRLQATQNYMVEYLENVCVHRYEKESRKEVVPDEKPILDEKELVIEEESEENVEKSEQEMRIRAILEEFLA